MSELTLAELEALTAVAAHRSFRAAAAAMGVSPSALSHAVAGLERRLGVRLFNRTTRSVAPTEAGSQFLAEVQPALRGIAEAVERVNSFRDRPAGLLRINTSEGGAARVLPLVLDYLATYPEMRVDLVSEGRLIDIVAAGFDAGLRLEEAVPQDMVAVSLGIEEALVVVGAPAYLDRRGTPAAPEDLARHDCLPARLPGGSLLRWEFERKGEVLRLDPAGRLILGSPELTLQAALAGAGLAYVTRRLAEPEIAAGRLRQVLAAWTPPFPGLCLYYPRQKLPSAGLRAFVEMLRARRGDRSALTPAAGTAPPR
jgi:DNA-binding transcriptional LysR family regulator